MHFIVPFLLCLAPRIAFLDAPEVWQFGFQDPATPIAQGIKIFTMMYAFLWLLF